MDEERREIYERHNQLIEKLEAINKNVKSIWQALYIIIGVLVALIFIRH